jgi:hypothetical protein
MEQMMKKNGKIDEKKQEVMGVFRDMQSLLQAIQNLKEQQVKIDTVFSPFFSHEVQEALKPEPSPIRYFALAGGVLGILAGFGLASYAHLEWKLITSGKPVLSWVSFFVIAFEGCILGGVLATVIGMIVKNRLFHFHLPEGYDPRFSQDQFGLFVICPEAGYDGVSSLLRDSGAEEVRVIRK